MSESVSGNIIPQSQDGSIQQPTPKSGEVAHGRRFLQQTGHIGLALLLIGVAALVTVTLIQNAMAPQTRTDFIAAYRSSRLGDFAINKQVTMFNNAEALKKTLLTMTIVGCVGGGLAVPAAAYFYIQHQRAEEMLHVEEERQKKAAADLTPQDAVNLAALRERVKTNSQVALVLAPIALILATIGIVAAVTLSKSSTSSFSGDPHQWDPRYIWTPIGGWVKIGSLNTTLLSTSGLDALKKAAIAMTAIGGAVALGSYVMHKAPDLIEKIRGQDDEGVVV